jgi:hypothetical protein
MSPKRRGEIMDITAAIDVAAGLVLMYLVLSLLCTTVNEFIANFSKLRANKLQEALQQLIDDPNLKGRFDLHGLIDGAKVASSGGKVQTTQNAPGAAGNAALPAASRQGLLAKISSTPLPSYLSGRSVALALIGTVNPDVALPAFEQVEAAVRALPESNIKDTLLASLIDADGSLTKFRDSVANWFDGAMDRLTGAYKRHMQLVSLIVGLIIAVIFNADTLYVGNQLWHDRSLSQSIAQSASDFVKTNCTAPQCQQAPNATLASAVDGFTKLEDNLRPFPIGWIGPKFPADFFTLACTKAWLWEWLAKIFGLAITASALMMGAPFWFDLLQKIMNLRATGDKPAKTPATAATP